MSRQVDRRTLLRSTGVVLAGAVAGCSDDSSTTSGNDDSTSSSDDSSNDDGSTPNEGDDSSSTDGTERESSPDTSTETDESETESQPSVEEFLDKTSNFDSIDDHTGSDSVTVEVGTEANGAFYGFSPPAIRIDPGTTVTWVWTGKGSVHNVSARHGAAFESEQQSEEGYTFEHTFDETGTTLYACTPHEGLGMKGAVDVE